MRVTFTNDAELDRVLLVTSVGNLDARGATHLWDTVESNLDEGSHGVVIDMSGVDFLSSAGIGILVRLLRRASRNGGTVALFGVGQGPLKVLQVCDLEDVLNVSVTLEHARDHF